MTRYEVELTDKQAREVLAYAGQPSIMLRGQVWQSLLRSVRANPPTKPPRMTEPRWRSQVIAHTADLSTRRGFNVEPWALGGQWHDVSGGTYQWNELIDPEPVKLVNPEPEGRGKRQAQNPCSVCGEAVPVDSAHFDGKEYICRLQDGAS